LPQAISLASQFVQPFAIVMDGGHHGRNLIDAALKGGESGSYDLVGNMRCIGAAHQFACGIFRGCRGAQRKAGHIDLALIRQKIGQSGSHSEAHDQHASRHWVQRARMPHALGTGDPTHPADNIVRCHSRRLIDIDYAVDCCQAFHHESYCRSTLSFDGDMVVLFVP